MFRNKTTQLSLTDWTHQCLIQGQCPHSIFFLSASIFTQLFSMRERLQQQAAEKKRSAQHLFFWMPHLFCLAGLSATSISKFKTSALFRKVLLTSLRPFQQAVNGFVVVSASGRSVRTHKWRRSWCWRLRVPGAVRYVRQKLSEQKVKFVCVFEFVHVMHPRPPRSMSVRFSCNSRSIPWLSSSSEPGMRERILCLMITHSQKIKIKIKQKTVKATERCQSYSSTAERSASTFLPENNTM